MDTQAIDLDQLRQAIGRQMTVSDTVTPQICLAFSATLDREPAAAPEGEAAPWGIHWCLAQPTVRMSALGPDGHPAKGGFLPAVPLPRRMWAGGAMTFQGPIHVGERITRVSRIENVTVKEGRSGSLCFVTVGHTISTGRGVVIEERQDIVYRGAEQGEPAKPAAAQGAPAKPTRKAEHSRTVMADPVLLFRYSALTFNAHRIHYDRNYATAEEGYPGLVVHGPLQATLLLTLACDLRGAPKAFDFRGASPLFDGEAFTVNAATTNGGMDLWVADSRGRETMTASAQW